MICGIRLGIIVVAVAMTIGAEGLLKAKGRVRGRVSERYRYGGGLVEGGHVGGTTGQPLDGEREPVGQIKRDRLRRLRRLLRLRVDRQPDTTGDGGGGQQTLARGRLVHRADHGQLHERRLMVLM